MTPRPFARTFFAIAIATPCALAAEADARRIDYEAPAACPDHAAAQAIVSRRTSASLVTEEARAATTNLRVDVVDGRFRGTLTTPDAAGEQTTRTIAGANCADVVDALAVVLAMHGEKAVPTIPANAESPAPTVALEPRSTNADVPPPPRPASARTGFSGELGIGLQGGIVTGATPTAAPRGEVVIAVGLRERTDAHFVQLWPRARFSLGLAKTSERVDDLLGRFSLFGGSFDACAVRFGGRSVGVWPCVRTEVGALSATTNDFVGAQARSTTWVAVGGTAVVEVRVAAPLFLQASLGAVAPLQRDRFVVEPSTSLHRVSSVAFVGTAGVGLSIW